MDFCIAAPATAHLRVNDLAAASIRQAQWRSKRPMNQVRFCLGVHLFTLAMDCPEETSLQHKRDHGSGQQVVRERTDREKEKLGEVLFYAGS